jgi:hypothetical protein
LLVAGLVLGATPVALVSGRLAPAAAAGCDTTPTAPPPAAISGGFHGIAPRRVADSRDGTGGIAKLSSGCSAAIDIGASGAVPAQARAVSINVTLVSERPGYLVVYPCGTVLPPTSNVNAQVGAAVPNLVVVALPESRRVCVRSDHPAHVIVDVTGWFGSGGAGFVPGGSTTTSESTRLLDTRGSLRPDSGAGRWPAATELALQVSPPGAVGWEAVSANITMTDPKQAGFVVAYSCGQAVPATSTVNVASGSTRANQTLVALDSSGRLCLWSDVDAHFIVDIVGRFAKGSGLPLAVSAAQRVVDSRSNVGGWTSAFRNGLTRPVDSAGGAPPTAEVALLNVVATGVTEAGYLTFYRCGSPVPATSSLNFAPGNDVTNLVTVDANTCVTGTGAAHVVVDRLGWFGRPGGLSSLSAGRPGTLQPGFERDGHDYSVPCSAGLNDIPVQIEAAPGRSIAIGGTDRGLSVTGTLPLNAGEVVTIVVTGPNATTETYALRCLPADFPPFTSVATGSASPGWYLTTLGYDSVLRYGQYAAIFDEHGALVWYRKTAQPIIDLKRLRSGDVSWVSLVGFVPFGADPTRGYEEHRLDGSLVATRRTVAGPTDHHDLRELPNGHLLLLTYVPRAGVDLRALGATYGASECVVDSVIEEIDPTLPAGSAPIWTWNSKDHFDVNETRFPQRFAATGACVTSTVDLTHVNSIEPQPNGDIVASFRHLDAVARISRSTGNVLWKVGGTTTTKDLPVGAKTLAIVDDPLGGPARQHSATIAANGNLLMFDNRTPSTTPPSTPIGPARVVEYALDLVGSTARLVRRIDEPLGRSAFGLGSVQRLGDGDTLVNWGPLQPVISQYDAANAVQLQVNQPAGGIGYRVVKEPAPSFDRATLRLLAG